MLMHLSLTMSNHDQPTSYLPTIRHDSLNKNKLDESAPQHQQPIGLEAIQHMLLESRLVINKLCAWVDTLSVTYCHTNSSATNSATDIMDHPCTTVGDEPLNMTVIQTQYSTQPQLPTHSMTTNA